MGEKLPPHVAGFLDTTISDPVELWMLVALRRAGGPKPVAAIARRVGLDEVRCRALLTRLAGLDLVELDGDSAAFVPRSRWADGCVAWLAQHRWRARPAVRAHLRSMPSRIAVVEA